MGLGQLLVGLRLVELVLLLVSTGMLLLEVAAGAVAYLVALRVAAGAVAYLVAKVDVDQLGA